MSTAHPTHLYLVDDSPAIRGRLVELFSRMEGVRIVGQSGDAATAVTDILALRPHSVVLDLNLGASNGMQVLRAIHAQLPDTVFVVLSNHSELQYRRACAKAGARFFLDKSTEFERVRDVVAAIAGTHH